MQKRLGDYIREVDERNLRLETTNILGLSMTKQFRASTSNIVGVDLSKYKIVRKNVFAFDTMSVIRVHKVPIAINDTDSLIIVSPAYVTFECKNTDELDPKYLMMWFKRKEFDRYADFKSDAAVRGGYDWRELCETLIYIPSIERQREIVAKYETLSKRIRLNEQIISTLEATAQTLYRKMFVDGIDKENLPDGWRLGTIGEFCNIITGNKDVNESLANGLYRFFSCSPTYYYSNEFIATGPAVLIAGNGSYTGRVTYYDKEFDLYQRTYACIPISQYINLMPYLYCVLKFEFQNKFIGGSRGSSIPYIVRGDIADFEFVYNENRCKKFSVLSNKVLLSTQIKLGENEKLTELQSLLLAKMGK